MPLSRFGRFFSRSRSATVGKIRSVIAGDAWAREQLAIIHRRLFQDTAPKSGPDHFVYVRPSRARCEIRELAGWVEPQFGTPGSRVPRQTPFGYLSSRWDGWLTLLAAVEFGDDRTLQSEFARSIAGIPWETGASSKTALLGLPERSVAFREDREEAREEPRREVQRPARPEPPRVPQLDVEPEPEQPEAGWSESDEAAARRLYENVRRSGSGRKSARRLRVEQQLFEAHMRQQQLAGATEAERQAVREAVARARAERLQAEVEERWGASSTSGRLAHKGRPARVAEEPEPESDEPPPEMPKPPPMSPEDARKNPAKLF